MAWSVISSDEIKNIDYRNHIWMYFISSPVSAFNYPLVKVEAILK